MSRSRKNALRRALRKSPLFAYESVCERFPDYRRDEYEADVRQMKATKRRKAKAGKNMQRYGRWQVIRTLLSDYAVTGNIESLQRAQSLRNRITKPYEIVFFGKGEEKGERFSLVLDASTSVSLVTQISKTTYSSFAELTERVKERLRYDGGNYEIQITKN